MLAGGGRAGPTRPAPTRSGAHPYGTSGCRECRRVSHDGACYYTHSHSQNRQAWFWRTGRQAGWEGQIPLRAGQIRFSGAAIPRTGSFAPGHGPPGRTAATAVGPPTRKRPINRPLDAALHPEPIHAIEGVGMTYLEVVPRLEVRHRAMFRVLRQEPPCHGRVEFEAKEGKALFSQER